MPRYIFVVEQEFEIDARDKEEALFLLPSYGWSPRPGYQMTAENIQLIETKYAKETMQQ